MYEACFSIILTLVSIWVLPVIKCLQHIICGHAKNYVHRVVNCTQIHKSNQIKALCTVLISCAIKLLTWYLHTFGQM